MDGGCVGNGCLCGLCQCVCTVRTMWANGVGQERPGQPATATVSRTVGTRVGARACLVLAKRHSLCLNEGLCMDSPSDIDMRTQTVQQGRGNVVRCQTGGIPGTAAILRPTETLVQSI